MQSWQTQSLVTLAFAAFIVVRFVRRELRPRIIRGRTVWLRPALILAVLGFLILQTLHVAPNVDVPLVLAITCGGLVGALTGGLVVRSTTYSAAGIPGAVRVHGSRVTAAVWIGAFALRLIARFLIPHASLGSVLVLDCGLIALLAVAFTMVALAFHRAIGRFAATQLANQTE
jgi:hypothetical protein